MNKTSDIYDEGDQLEFGDNYKGKSRNANGIIDTDRSTDADLHNVPQNTIMNWNESRSKGGSSMGFSSYDNASQDMSQQSV